MHRTQGCGAAKPGPRMCPWHMAGYRQRSQLTMRCICIRTSNIKHPLIKEKFIGKILMKLGVQILPQRAFFKAIFRVTLYLKLLTSIYKLYPVKH